MDKRDIYEHLAKIYLDASSKKKIKSNNYQGFKGLFFASIAIVLTLSLSLVAVLNKDKAVKGENALFVSLDAVKINFNFDPAKKETYSIDLRNLNLSKYKAVAFSLKKATYEGKITLRVELANHFKERSEVYIRDIPHKWQEYKINFSDFSKINDWSEVSKLSFIVEQWNAKENSGVLYIDNIRFLH